MIENCNNDIENIEGKVHEVMEREPVNAKHVKSFSF